MTDEHDADGPMHVPVPVKVGQHYQCPQCGATLTLYGDPAGSEGGQCPKCGVGWTASFFAEPDEGLTACGTCEHSADDVPPEEGGDCICTAAKRFDWWRGVWETIDGRCSKVNTDGHCPHYARK